MLLPSSPLRPELLPALGAIRNNRWLPPAISWKILWTRERLTTPNAATTLNVVTSRVRGPRGFDNGEDL